MPGNIKQLEIFAAGKHHASTGTIEVSETELDQIVEAFGALNGTNIVKPHLKLGHTDAQKWFGQKDGIPALGWIDRVWRQGKKLYADISNVPDALMDMIRGGRYHNVSSEIYFDAPIEHNGKKWPRVLSAVALLGAEMPAVKDLAGLASALFSDKLPSVEGANVVSIETGERSMFTQEQVDALTSSAVDKAVKETEARFTAENESLKAEVEVLKTRAESAEQKVAEVKAAAVKAEAETLVNAAIKEGKLLPKQKDFAMAFLANGTMVKFGEGEKSTVQLFKEFLDAAGKQVALGEQGSDASGRKDYASAAEEVDVKVREITAKEDKVSYKDALQRVLASDADLKARYFLAQN